MPLAPVEGDLNGLRLGTPELVRWGVTAEHAVELAGLISRGLTSNDLGAVAQDVKALRARFQDLNYILT